MTQGLFKYFGGASEASSKRSLHGTLSTSKSKKRPRAGTREQVQQLQAIVGEHVTPSQLEQLLRENGYEVERAANMFFESGLPPIVSSQTCTDLSSSGSESGGFSPKAPPKQQWPKRLCSLLVYAESTVRLDEEEMRALLHKDASLRVIAQDSAPENSRKGRKAANSTAQSKKGKPVMVAASGRRSVATIVRISVLHHEPRGGAPKDVFFARLPKNLASAVHPLMKAGLVDVSVTLHSGFLPEGLSPFSMVPVTINVDLKSSKVLSMFPGATSQSDALDYRAAALFDLMCIVLADRGQINKDFESNTSNESESGGVEVVEGEGDSQQLSQHIVDGIVEKSESDDTEFDGEVEAPPGLAITLRPHQFVALKWMLGRERAESSKEATNDPLWQPFLLCDEAKTTFYINIYSRRVIEKPPPPPQPVRGGILADEMGLGKTICVLAVVLAQLQSMPPSPGKLRHRKTGGTLIICPVSLIGQWRDEFTSKVDPSHKLKLHLYHGNERGRGPLELSGFDCVFSTYGVVASEYKAGDMSGLLGTKWTRVVLDEAHVVKNQNTEGAKAVTALKSKYRWCLTGTPLQNTMDDLFSLVKFLQFEPWNSYQWWSKVIRIPFEQDKDQEESKAAMERLRSLLNDGPLMLRRTKRALEKANYKMTNQLPPKHVQVVEIDLSENEQQFYSGLFKHSKAEFEGFVGTGSAGSKYAAIFTLLLRLRQACDHPYLALGKNRPDDDTGEFSTEGLTSHGEQGYLKALRAKLLEADKNDSNAAFVEASVASLGTADQECPICLDIPSNTCIVRGCGHVFCSDCLKLVLRQGPMECPVCRRRVARSDVLDVSRVDHKGSEKRESSNLGQKHWRTSTKLENLMSSLQELATLNRKILDGECLDEESSATYLGESKPGQAPTMPIKSLVFSQWTGMLDFVQQALEMSEYAYERLDGSMSQTNRDKAVSRFMESKTANVLLISLKAGGVGLNLTAASVVYILDPWWNPQVENQAIARVHRYGQTRPVHVKRLVARGTVEVGMLSLQEKKAAMANDALDDWSAMDAEELRRKSAGNKLTLDDFLFLFGRKS